MWVVFLFTFTGLFAMFAYGAAGRIRRKFGKSLLICLAVSMAVGSLIAFGFKGGTQNLNAPPPTSLFDRLTGDAGFLMAYLLEFTFSPAFTSKRQRLAWEFCKWVVIATGVALLVTSSEVNWAEAVLFLGLPALRAIRRRSLGAALFEFPRFHNALLVVIAAWTMAVALFTFVACCVAGYWNLMAYPAVLAVIGLSLWRNAGRLVLRQNGLEGAGVLWSWKSVDRYEWFESEGEPVLRIVCEARGELADGNRDIRYPSRQIPQVDTILAEHGVKAI